MLLVVMAVLEAVVTVVEVLLVPLTLLVPSSMPKSELIFRDNLDGDSKRKEVVVEGEIGGDGAGDEEVKEDKEREKGDAARAGEGGGAAVAGMGAGA